MSLAPRLMRLYFDLLYNPVYDLTTGGLTLYNRAQDSCVSKLEFAEGDRVLCVGVGTGNEVRRILNKNARVHIVGVDFSASALQRASQKATANRTALTLCRMDACELSFADETFDKALCLHVMGFVDDDRKATAEIVRVLKEGAQFVITYPAGGSLLSVGREIARSVGHKFKSRRWKEATRELASLIGAGIFNIPVSLMVKPRDGFYSRRRLETMLAEYGLSGGEIEEDKVYQEFVISGRKVSRI